MNLYRGLVLVLTIAASTAVGATIDFNTLGGADLSPFTTYTENGFTVTGSAVLPVGGGWGVSTSFGNTIPAIFCNRCAPGTLEVSGGQFRFSSIDLGNPVTPGFDYTFTGFLGGSQVLLQTGTQNAGSGHFSTVTITNSSQLLDDLFISINTDFINGSVDNINVIAAVTAPATAPEPGTGALLLGALAMRWRRRKT